jgi:hypothetical protein
MTEPIELLQKLCVKLEENNWGDIPIECIFEIVHSPSSEWSLDTIALVKIANEVWGT